MKKIQKIIFTLIYTFLVMAAGFAADFTWNGSNSSAWNASSNWTLSGTLPPGHLGYPSSSSDTAIITSNGYAPILNTSIPIKLNSLTINSGSLTITGNNTSLILSGNFTHNGGTFSAGPNTTVTFNGSSSTIGGSRPTSFANLTVATSRKVKLDQAITVGGTFTNSGDFNINQKNVTFNGAVINNGTFKTYIPMQPAANSQLTFKQNFNNNGTFTADSKNTAIFQGQNSKITGTSEPEFGNLTIDGPAKLKLENNIKVAGIFKKNGYFDANTKTVTFTTSASEIKDGSEPTFFNLTIASGATLKLNRDTVKISGTFTNNGSFDHNNKTVIFNGLLSKIAGNTETKFYNLTVDANKILHLEQNIIVVDTFENGGIFKAQGKTVTLNPAGTEVKIEGKNTATDTTFAEVSCLGAGGKTLTINGKIMVADLKIGGASEVNKLTVQGGAASEITLTSNQTPDPGTKKGYYLNVNTNIPIADGKTYYVAESVLGNPNPKNWEHMSSTWKTNATTTNWNTASNWTPEVVPAADWPVIIPAGGTKYPKLTTNVSAKSVKVNGELDLADYVINDTSNTAPLTNNGLLKMTGTAGSPTNQKDWLESSNTNDFITHIAGSKIEYYSNTNNSVWDGPYKNLILGENRAILTANDLKVTGTLTVASTASNLVAINAATQTYDGHINLQKNTTFSSTGANGTMFNGSVSTSGIDIGFSGNGRIQTKDITAKDIIVNAGTNTWTSSGAITAYNITVHRTWNSTGNVTANGSITANGWTAKNVSLKGDLTVARFNQTAGTLTFDGTGTPEQELNFTGAGNKNINHLTIDTGAKVKLLSSVSIAGTLTNKGTFNAGTGNTITFKGASFTNSGTFTAGATNTVTLNPTGNTVTITGTDNAGNTTFRNLSLTGAGGKTLTINGKISVNGNLTLQGSGAADAQLLTIAGGTNGPGIKLSANQTGNGKWLKVHTNIPMIPEIGGKTYTVTESKAHEVSTLLISDGNPKNWIFSGYAGPMTWKGTHSSNWNGWQNWRPYGIPGGNSDVTIPQKEAAAHYPKLTAPSATNPAAQAKSVTVNQNAELYLEDQIINLNGGSLTSYGKVYLKNTPTQKTWIATFNHEQGSTIVYRDVSSTNSAIWEGPYKNLFFESSVIPDTITSSSLTVSQQLTVNKSITLDTGSGNQTYDGTINAGGYDVTLKGSTITTKHNITANNIKVLGDWNSNKGNITVATNIQAAKWNSEDGTISAGNDITVTGIWYSERSSISGRNITSSGSSWTSWGRITATGNIDIENELAFTGGRITVGGNLTAKKLNASSNANSGGLIFFNGSGTQKLSGKSGNNIEGGKIQNLQIDSGTTLQLESDITITVGLNNQGVFDAVTNGKKVTLEHKISEIKIEGKTNKDNTKFHELICSGAGGKFLKIDRGISVTGDLTLSGANDSTPLTIYGSNDAKIYLSTSHDLDSSNNAKGNFLKIYTGNVKIRPEGKYYVVKNSKDDSGKKISKNGWIFYKDSLQIVNSFAKPNDNHIYLLFDDDSLSTEEFHSLKALSYSLQITDGVTTYTSNLQTVHKEPSSYIPSGHSLWKIQLDGTQKFNPDDILKSNYQVSLNYFHTNIQKKYISDIGIGMVEPLTASNSIVLRNFNAGDNDPALPTLDLRVLAEKAPSSSNVILHFFSKNSAEHKFWYPSTMPPPPSLPPINLSFFANSQAGTTNYSPTLNGNLMTFIIPSTDPYLKEGKIGQFMYVYDNWLPCARLRNPNDILSFDVWNFKIVGVRMQKGGVSIFDNVVNPHKGQSATIAAHLKKSGMLTIQIMTLDGNIVRTLTRSHHNAGDHFYLWDGRNNGGNPVASGMYFVRIAGPDIDEVRKILIIK